MNKYLETSSTDALTNLLTRKDGEQLLLECINNQNKTFPFSLLLVDIDHFEDINKTYGHTLGDLVISSIAKIILANIRETDFPIRWGGQEFLLCLPTTNLKDAILMAEKIRLNIESTELENKQSISASFGGAEIGEEGLEVALVQVEGNLHLAKLSGRNQTFPNKIEKDT